MVLLLSIVQIGHADIYEAEDATVVGAVIKSTNSGYTGTGYADYQNASGDYVEWTVTMASGGDYDIAFRYALGNTDRPLEIQVNGDVVDPSLNFPDTGGWSPGPTRCGQQRLAPVVEISIICRSAKSIQMP
jgi:hypothetical protein